jgi:hypothetical protein
MMKLTYSYEREGKFYVGWLDAYPDQPTQAFSIVELEDNLRDIYGLILDGTLTSEGHGVLQIPVAT